ncbi:MAG: hypothetical protein KAU94_05190 [Verrucomicrobia bacterium]|nr:hypothetical protein [Verrucomicrobiota bacterium]
MKNIEKTVLFKTMHGYLLATFLMGVAGVSPQLSMAESNDGRINAKEDVASVRRDPFWPVGHTPEREGNPIAITPKQGVGGSIDWDEAMKQIVINGVSSRADNEYIAVINNEVKSVGESVSTWLGGTHYTWVVDSITPPGSVKLRRHAVE